MTFCRDDKKNQILKYILNKETPEEAFEPDTEEQALLELIARKVKSGYYGANVSDALIEQFIAEYLTEHPIEAVEIANNLTTATTGKALDATQGKALKDLLDALSERIDNLPAGGGTGGGSGTSADVPVATTSTAGVVKPDGTSITITSDGTISAATASAEDVSNSVNAYMAEHPVSATVGTDSVGLNELNSEVFGSTYIVDQAKSYPGGELMLSDDDLIQTDDVVRVTGTIYVSENSVTAKPSLKLMNTLNNTTGEIKLVENIATGTTYEVDATATATRPYKYLNFSIKTSSTATLKAELRDIQLYVNGVKKNLTVYNNTLTPAETEKEFVATKSQVSSKAERDLSNVSKAVNLSKIDNDSQGNNFIIEKSSSYPSVIINMDKATQIGDTVSINGIFVADEVMANNNSKLIIELNKSGSNSRYALISEGKVGYNIFSETFTATTAGLNSIMMRISASAVNTIKGKLVGLSCYINGVKANFSIAEDASGIVMEDTLEIQPLATKKDLYELTETKVDKIVKKDFTLPWVDNLFVVSSKYNKKILPVFIDYLYNGNNDKILFDSDSDREYLYPRAYNPDKTQIYVNQKTLKFKSDTLNVADVNFNVVSLDEGMTNGDIRLLIIGDSVTAGAITSKQYWRFAAENFAKEDLIKNRTSNVMFLGSNNFGDDTITYKDKSKSIHTAACGISGTSLNWWLTNVTDGNGFTYEDTDGTVKFSINKWLERYRTHDDSGNKLTLGDGTGTLITSDNIDNVQCCTPNIVYINHTHNGGTIEEYEQIISIIRTELPDCKIIIGAGMPIVGSWHIDRYVGKDWADPQGILTGPNYGWSDSAVNRMNLFKYFTDKAKHTDWLFYMPQPVITPTVEGYEYEEVPIGTQTVKMVTNQSLPKEHPGTHTHAIWGYELYCLLKYIVNKDNAEVTTNEVTTTLSSTTESLSVGGTTTLTAATSSTKETAVFSSSDESVATVDSTGLVTAIGAGECYIYAKAPSGILPANCKITVTE